MQFIPGMVAKWHDELWNAKVLLPPPLFLHVLCIINNPTLSLIIEKQAVRASLHYPCKVPMILRVRMWVAKGKLGIACWTKMQSKYFHVQNLARRLWKVLIHHRVKISCRIFPQYCYFHSSTPQKQLKGSYDYLWFFWLRNDNHKKQKKKKKTTPLPCPELWYLG